MNESEEKGGDVKKGIILIIDDEITNLKLLRGILQSDYKLLLAKSGDEALRRASEKPDLILLDIMMPVMDGYEVARLMKEMDSVKDVPIIFVSALDEEGDETKGFDVGAVDYITKPVKPAIVRARVKAHMELRHARAQLQNQNIILEEKVKERTRELNQSRLEIVQRLVFAAEYKDPETAHHIKRMSNYTSVIAKAYGFNDQETEIVLYASPMHDIGKMGIPDDILLKPAALNGDEWQIMRSHPGIGAKILANSHSDVIRAGQTIAISHHEKWDGSGYPQGLKRGRIPLFGRMAAIADVFDALTTRRPYKDPWPIDKALEEINNGGGSHFDPDLVKLFMENIDTILEIKQRFPEEN